MVKFRKSVDSLAGRLIITIGILMTAGSLLFGTFFIKYEEKIMINNLTNYASLSVDLIKNGIHSGMLAAQRKDIQKTIEAIGREKDITGIRVIKPDGKIIYSNMLAEIGNISDMSAIQYILESKNNYSRFTTDAKGTKILKFNSPINNEASCSSAACHFHSPDTKILGVLETDFSTSAVDDTVRQNRIATILFGGLFVASISVILCMIIYKFVSKPVALLEQGMKRLAKGDFDHHIDIHTKDEMGLLASSFTDMAQEIKQNRENMEKWTRGLEDEVQKKTAEIIKAQDQLINAEKLASLGRMSAGVAHELNSPLTGIVTFAHLMLKRVPPENKQDIEDLNVIIDQAERCSKIIKGLLGFSRKAASEKATVNINTLIESTLAMVKNQAKFYNIEIDVQMDRSLPEISVDPNQIQQVFVNLLINAADAMEEKGKITITSRPAQEGESRFIELEFRDTGPGISPESIGRVFEPFFTTKPAGKGTGLGLSVSYGIIKKHEGQITVKSEKGKGASFLIRLPLK